MNASIKFTPSFPVFKHLREFVLCDAFEKAIGGGFGSGKSHHMMAAVLRSIATNCVRARNLAGAVAGLTYTGIARTTMRTARDMCRMAGLRIIEKKQDKLWIFPEFNNFELYWLTVDAYENWAGANFGVFGCDEISMWPRDAYLAAVNRVRDTRFSFRQLIGAGTDEGRNWAYDYWVAQNPAPDRRRMFYADTRRNPYVPEDFIEALKRSYPPELHDAVLGGQWGVARRGGGAYHAFSRGAVATAKFNPALPIRLAFDFNVNPMSLLICQDHEPFGHGLITVLDEVVMPNTVTAAAIEEFIHRHFAAGRGVCDVEIYGDASGNARGTRSFDSDYKIIRAHLQDWRFRVRLKIPSKNPPVRDRVACVNNMLSLRRIYIDPKCVQLLRSLEETRIADGSDGHVLNKADNIEHASDALGYLCHATHPIRVIRGMFDYSEQRNLADTRTIHRGIA